MIGARPGRWGMERSGLGAGSRVLPMRRERGGIREKERREQQWGQGAHARRTRACCVAVQTRGAAGGASTVGCACELDGADGGGLRMCLDAHVRPDTGRSHLSKRLWAIATYNLNLLSHIKNEILF
jgi:hypothetical protein